MLKKVILIAGTMFFVGCSTNLAENFGLSGSYDVEQVNQTTYFIKYTTGAFTGPFPTEARVKPNWMSKARELCGSDDFLEMTQGQFLGKGGFTIAAGSPNIKGYAFCNNKFQDTRDQKPDEGFLSYQNLEQSQLQFQDFTPLWQFLSDEKFEQLEKLLKEFENSFSNSVMSENELVTLLATFGRVTLSAETHFDNWIKTYPNSYMAYHARSLYLDSMGWYHRGNNYWNDVPEEDKRKFTRYSERSLADAHKALELKTDFVPSHIQRVRLVLGGKTLGNFEEVYIEADAATQGQSLALKKAYLRGLQPRWRGSMEEMKTFIDGEVKKDKRFSALESGFITEQGDQLFQEKKYDEALVKYKDALLYENSAYTNYRIGVVLQKQNKYVNALDYYRSARDLNPYYDSVYEVLVSLFIKQGDYISALTASHYLTAMNNRDAYNFVRQGHIYYSMRRYEDALVSYKLADIVEPEAEKKHFIRSVEFQLDVREGDKKISQPLEVAL